MFVLNREHGACPEHNSGTRVQVLYFGNLGVNLGNDVREEIVQIHFLPISELSNVESDEIHF